MMRVFVLLAICAFSLSSLSGCNTVEGFGQDIERAGEKIQEL